jgi:sec-independent protein translocase protein TatC
VATDVRGYRAADGELDFWRHVEDLRKALFWSVLGWLAGTIVAWQYWTNLWRLLLRPLSGLKKMPQIIVTSPTGAVTMSFQVALVAGSLLAAPWVFWQLWRFVRPALHLHERRIVLGAVWWSTFLFAIGIVIGYFTIFPMTLKWLAGYGDGMFVQMWTVDEYTGMSVKLLGGFASMFEFPLVTWVLGRLGVLEPRQLLRWSRGAIVVIFVLAAVVTPPDPVSQCIMAVPMLALYFAGIGTSWLARRKT